jgi:hypothetical protein
MCAARLRKATLAALGGTCLWLSACSGAGVDLDDRAGLSCLDDSPACIARREATLKAMLADPARKWVRETPTPEAHASGVRLFAFRSRKAELTCEELAQGRREAAAAPKALKGRRGLSPAQISRASLLAAEVAGELGAEIGRRRCRDRAATGRPAVCAPFFPCGA